MWRILLARRSNRCRLACNGPEGTASRSAVLQVFYTMAHNVRIRLSDEISHEGEQSTSHRLPVLTVRANRTSLRVDMRSLDSCLLPRRPSRQLLQYVESRAAPSPVSAGPELLQATSVSRPDVRLGDADQARLKWLVRTCRFRHKGPMVLLPFRCLFRQLFAIETRLPPTRCE